MLIWLVLSGFFNLFFISLGAISCFLGVYISAKIAKQFGSYKNIPKVFFKIILYFFWLLKEITISSLKVSALIWDGNISPKSAWIPVTVKDDITTTILANSITLTPGTVTIGVRGGMLYIHAIKEDNIEDIRKGYMNNKIKSVFKG